MSLLPGEILAGDANSKLPGPHRILWANPRSELCIAIPIPDFTAAQPPHYWCGPTKLRYTEVALWKSLGQGVPRKISPPPITCLTDDEIRARYGRKGPDGTVECSALRCRAMYWSWIEPIVKEIRSDAFDVYESGRLPGLIKAQADKHNKGINQISNALHRYLALACGENSLLPMFPRCGGPGKAKKRGPKKMGAPNILVRATGNPADAGFNPTMEDIRKLQYGWRRVTAGTPVSDAYFFISAAFWSAEVKEEYGRLLPTLLDPRLRPSEAQFRYWGPKGDGAAAAWMQQLPPREFRKRFRALFGTARDGIKAFGQVAFCDSTSTDAKLTSTGSRLKVVGPANRLLIADGWFDMICGWDAGLEAPSGKKAMLAVNHAASSKIEYCARHGITISDDEIPPVLFAKYLVDNGEFRTEKVMRQLLDNNSAMELAASGAADLKGPVEALHHSLHKRLDHRIAGTTFGRQRRRGEPPSAIAACWQQREYEHELILAVLYHNTKANAERYLTQEMRRDGVKGVRVDMYRWAREKGYIASPLFDPDHLRAHTLPRIKAVVHRNGVFLLRPDRGDKREIVQGHCYVGARALEQQWFEKAARGAFEIEVGHDPNNLSKVWHFDETGPAILTNRARDPELVEWTSMGDTLSMQDDGRLKAALGKAEADQAQSDLIVGREAADADKRKRKRKEIDALGRRVTKIELTSDMRKNRADEIKVLADASQPKPPVSAQLEQTSPAPAPESGPDSVDRSLELFRQRRKQHE